MTEQEKAAAGLLYDANYDPALLEQRRRCKELCHTFNQLSPTRRETEGAQLLRTLLGSVGERPVVTAPFWCDYGCNITLGDDFYANHNCVMLDGAPITIGSHVFFGPNCCLSTAGHPLDAERRNQGLEYAKPITIGDDVWLGANVTVLPGVTDWPGCGDRRGQRGHPGYPGGGGGGGSALPACAPCSGKGVREQSPIFR